MDKLKEVLDKNIELTQALENKLIEFKGLLTSVLVGMTVLTLIMFVIILWLVLN